LLSSDVPEVQPSFRAQNERTTNTARGGLQSLRGRVTDRVPRGSIVQLSVCVESEGDLRPETESVAEPLPEGFNTLERVDDTWTPISQQRQLNEDDDSPARVDRKVKSLLNKLTMEKFDSISDRIIAWANRSRSEKDARTLIQVTRTVFDKAVDNAAHSEVYARLCRKMMEQISPDVQDESIKGSEGKPIAGGQLFRKYLLDRCHEGFERGWAPREAVVAAAKAKAGDDAAVLAANADKMEDKIALYSDEYYAEQKAKQRGLGLVKFIGELFKLQMLTERPMHECVKKLLGNVDNPEEEDIESLCVLLSTVGKLLDTQRASPYMDIYFARMRELSKNPKVSSRMQYMLLVSAWFPLLSMATTMCSLPYTVFVGGQRVAGAQVDPA
jgi:translation initiation factor 4G